MSPHEFNYSFSLLSGVPIVAILSALFAFFTARIKSPQIRWGAFISIPTAIAYCMYWGPIWFATTPIQDTSEYSAWQLVPIGIWGLVGMYASTFIELLILRKKQPSVRLDA